MNTRRLTAFVKRAFPRWHTRWVRHQQQRQRRTIGAILARPGAPQHYDSCPLFAELQKTYCQVPHDYKYDAFSVWQRGVERAQCLLQRTGLQPPGSTILEAACGDGMTGSALSAYGHHVTLTDLEDWRDARAKALPFVLGNLCGCLNLAPGLFDLIYSFNAFEHVDDPQKVLTGLLRMCKPGGMIYINFCPLYASPWGLHAYRTIFAPYPQYLFSMDFIERQLQAAGGVSDLGRQRETLQQLNGWTLAQFDHLWKTCGAKIVELETCTDYTQLNLIRRLPDAFSGRGLTFDDVVTDEIFVLLKKQ